MGLPLWVWVSFAMSLGFAHGDGDHGLLHLVLIVLTVDWYYSLSISFFIHIVVDGRLWVVGDSGVRCV